MSKTTAILSKCTSHLTMLQLLCRGVGQHTQLIYPLHLLQKGAIWIINKVASREHSNRLFIKSRVIQLKHKFEFENRIHIVIFRAKTDHCLNICRDLFVLRWSGDDHRRKSDCEIQYACTSFKQHFSGDKLWNSLGIYFNYHWIVFRPHNWMIWALWATFFCHWLCMSVFCCVHMMCAIVFTAYFHCPT